MMGVSPETQTANAEEAMSAEYVAWIKEQNLPDVCAEELILEDLTSDQRRWVGDFILRWETMQEDRFADGDDNPFHPESPEGRAWDAEQQR